MNRQAAKDAKKRKRKRENLSLCLLFCFFSLLFVMFV